MAISENAVGGQLDLQGSAPSVALAAAVLGGQLNLQGGVPSVAVSVHVVGGQLALQGSVPAVAENNAVRSLIQEAGSNYYFRKILREADDVDNTFIPLSTVPGVTTAIMKTGEAGTVEVYGTVNPLGLSADLIDTVPDGDWALLASGNSPVAVAFDLIGNYTGFKCVTEVEGDTISLRRLERRK